MARAGRPVQVLEIFNNSFKIDEAAFGQVLNRVGHRKFVLFCVNGATRTGKSYALNYFVRYLHHLQQSQVRSHDQDLNWFNVDLSEKFMWRGGHERTTIGINLWSEPFIIKMDQDDLNSEEIAVLLMDCQGLFDNKTTALENSIIFSLSTLCSSVSIFNVKGLVDENILQQLSFFSSYAKMMSRDDNLNSNPSSSRINVKPFQNLVFLIRDSDDEEYFGYHDNQKSHPQGQKNYYNDIFLLLQAENHNQNQIPPENLEIRKSISRNYDDIAICVLPDPGTSFRRNKTTQPEDEFNEYLKSFIELLHTPSKLKATLKRSPSSGVQISGFEFKELIRQWANVCRKSEEHFPKVQSNAVQTAIIHNTTAVETATNYYKEKSTEFMNNSSQNPNQNQRPIDAGDLAAFHQKTMQEAIAIFDRMPRIDNKEIKDKYLKNLLIELQHRYEGNQKINEFQLEKYRENERYQQELERKEKELSNLDSRNKLAIMEMERKMKDEQERFEALMAKLENDVEMERQAQEKEDSNFFSYCLSVSGAAVEEVGRFVISNWNTIMQILPATVTALRHVGVSGETVEQVAEVIELLSGIKIQD